MIAVLICGICLAAMGWVIAGYPKVLAWLAQKHPKPVARGDYEPVVSVIIAAHNGERFLAEKLDSVLALQYPSEKLEVIVVSDGSTDRTEEIARSYQDRGVRLMQMERGGKPAALNLAIPTARGEILVLTDVRQLLEATGLRMLTRCFHDPSVGVVSGDLIIRNPDRSDEKEIAQYWDYERNIRIHLGQVDSLFGATGPYYAIRKALAIPVPADILLDDVYLPLNAFFKGYRLIVEPGARAFDYPTTIEMEFYRKVRTLAGNYQILQAYPALLGSGNRLWWHFMSYKVGRLMLPYGLLVLVVASFYLPEPIRTIAVGGQCLGYCLAALDRFLPAGSIVKRLSSPARTFVSLVGAALFALSVFFVEPRKLWRVTSNVIGKNK